MRRAISVLLAATLFVAACGVPQTALPPPPAPGFPWLPPSPDPPVGPVIPPMRPPDFDGFSGRLFDEADTNHNGRLTRAEIKACPALADVVDAFPLRLGHLKGWTYPEFAAALRPLLTTDPDGAVSLPVVGNGRTPVLLVQGYGEPSFYFMYGIYRHLRRKGWPVFGINLFPNIASADVQSRKVEARIKQILAATRSSKINLVCHSFGGLIARRIIQQMGGAEYVDHYVSIATPHYGTHWCPVGPGAACDDMRIGSPFLSQLNRQTIWPPVKYGCIWTRSDEIVLPPESAVLPGARVFPPVPFTEHLFVLWSPTTYRYVDESLAT